MKTAEYAGRKRVDDDIGSDGNCERLIRPNTGG